MPQRHYKWRTEHGKWTKMLGLFVAPIIDENNFNSVIATGSTPCPLLSIHNHMGYVPFLSPSLSSLYVVGKLTYLS
jgi:hypothetical protein